MNTGKLFPAHGLQDAVVDEVGLRPFDRLQDLVHLLSGTEPVVGHTLALAPGTFPGTAAPALFFDFGNNFHNDFVVELKNNDYLCSENPKVGGFPLPLVSNPDFESHFDFPNPYRNREFHGALGFRFSYSFQGFRISLSSSLLTLQRYEKFLNYTNKIKEIFKKIIIFFPKNLHGMDIIPIFAASKFKSRYDAAGLQPAFFMPLYSVNKTTAPCRQAETPRRSRDLSLDNASCSFFMSKYQIV